MKLRWLAVVAVASFMFVIPAFGNGQSLQPIQVQIEHLKHCNELMTKYIELSKGEEAIQIMIEYKSGTVTISSQDLNSDLQPRVARLEAQNSIYDLGLLRKKQLNDILTVLRKNLGECSDTSGPKNWEPIQLMEIGITLIKLDQAEDAIPVLRRCISVDSDFAGCFETLGKADLALGRREEAKDSFKRTLSIGGFDEFNAESVQSAKTNLAAMEMQDEKSKATSASEEVKPAQHAFGTGFFVSKDGEILTNNHVVAGCRYLTIKDGQPVQIVSREPDSDLALVKANLKPNQIAVFRSGPAPKIGDAVVTFGFPLPGILSSDGNVSSGILSASTGLQNDIRFVQISAPVQPGNSGGPVFDTSGHVIGVVVAKLDALRLAQLTGDLPQNINFAVHWSEVRSLLDEQRVPYSKLLSQHAISTRDIAKIGAEISVTLDCAQ
jgi:S1-C subfamily serine protease